MRSLIESLESRTLLSVAPSVGVLKAEGKVVLANLVSLEKIGKANFKAIEGDLKIGGGLKTSGTLLKTLASQGSEDIAAVAKNVKSAVGPILADVNKLAAAGNLLNKHPGVAADEAKVTAAANKLQSDAAARLTAITSSVTAQHDTNATNLKAILDANPGNTRLSSDVTDNISPNTANARDALTESATTALSTDVNAVITAFPA
jgi:hypothetical protein